MSFCAPRNANKTTAAGGFRSRLAPQRKAVQSGGRGVDTSLSASGVRIFDRSGAEAPKTEDDEMASVQREFIANLQQQVYFLEMELRYLKQKREQHHTDSSSVATHLSGAASGLDKFVQDLRKRCEEMETKFVDAQSAVVAARERALEERTEKEILCNSLKKDVADMQQRMETALQDRRVQLAPAEKESARLDVQRAKTAHEVEVERETRDRLQARRGELEVELAKLQSEVDLLQTEGENMASKVESAEAAAEASESDAARYEVQLKEVEQDLETNKGSMTEEEEKQLEQRWHDMVSGHSNLKFQLETSKMEIGLLEKRISDLENEQKNKGTEYIELLKQVEEAKAARVREDASAYQKQLAEQSTATDVHYVTSCDTELQKKGTEKTVADAVRTSKAKLKRLQEEQERERDVMEGDEGPTNQEEVLDRCRESKCSLLKVQDSFTRLQQQHSSLESALADAENRSTQLHSRLDSLQLQRDRVRAVSSIDAGELHALVASNKVVAERMQSLLSGHAVVSLATVLKDAEAASRLPTPTWESGARKAATLSVAIQRLQSGLDKCPPSAAKRIELGLAALRQQCEECENTAAALLLAASESAQAAASRGDKSSNSMLLEKVREHCSSWTSSGGGELGARARALLGQ